MISKISILLIEENLPLQHTLSYIFRRRGFEVVSAAPDLNALALLAEFSFDLIVLGLNPSCDKCLSLFLKIKRDHALLPVILLSANPETEVIPGLNDEVAWMIIRKPFEPSFLLKSIYAITSGVLKRESQLTEAVR